MKIQHRLLLPVAGTMLAILTILAASDYSLRKSATSALDERIAAKIAEINSYLDLTQRFCLSHAALYSRDPRVLEAYEIALAGDIKAADDPMAAKARELLRGVFSPIRKSFAEITGDPDYHLHFHLPSGRSLYRVWRTAQSHSDDISSFRKTVVEINSESGRHAPIVGVEIGRGGFVIRGLAPITAADGRHLGSVEMLSPYVPLIMAAKSDAQQEFGVFMNADRLATASKLADRTQHPLIGDRFALVTATDRGVLLPLVSENLLDAGAATLTKAEVDQHRITLFPIHDYSGKQVGVIAYALDHSEFSANLARLRLTLLLVSGGLIVALGLVAFWSARSITVPLQNAVALAESVARGDLSERVEEDRRDELGDLGRALNAMTESLAELTSRMRTGSGTLRTTVSGLNDRSTALSNDSEKMTLAVDTVSSATEELSAAVQEIAGSAEEMSGMLSTVATSIDEMTVSVREVARNASRGSQIVQQTTSRSKATVEIMQRLQEASGKIGKVLDVITAISDQTNLLALNATIEAAGAGEAGKGFAVVAGEVKELARQTARAAEEINREIEEMRSTTVSAVEAIENTTAAVAEVDSITAAIAAAVEQQSATLSEIAVSGGEASASAREISRQVQEGAEGAREIVRSILTVQEAAKTTDQGVQDTMKDSARLQALADTMDAVVSKFRA